MCMHGVWGLQYYDNYYYSGFNLYVFLRIMYSVVQLPLTVIYGAIEMTVIIIVSLDVHQLEYLKAYLAWRQSRLLSWRPTHWSPQGGGPLKNIAGLDWKTNTVQWSDKHLRTYGHRQVVMSTHMHVHTHACMHTHTQTTTKGKMYTEWCYLNFATHKKMSVSTSYEIMRMHTHACMHTSTQRQRQKAKCTHNGVLWLLQHKKKCQFRHHMR